MSRILSSNVRFNNWYYLLALIAGLSTVFAFAPFHVYPLAWLAPALLFYILTRAKRTKQYFYLGWLFGIGMFGAGASWPFYSMHFFAHAPLLLAAGGTAFFVAFISLFSMGLFGLLASVFRDTPLLTRLLLFYPASWVLLEWFRGWFLTGFPWLYLGHSQIDTVFAGFAPILGVLGVSWSSALIAGALVSLLIGNSATRTLLLENNVLENNELENKIKNQVVTEERFGASSRILASLLIVLLAVSSYTFMQIQWTTPLGEPISVSIPQGNIPQGEKFKPEQLAPTLKLYTDMTHQSKNSSLIVWPETALPDVFARHMDSLIIPLQDFAKKNHLTLMLGGFYQNEKGGVENSVLSLTSKSREVYSKQHLVPFGEYIPFLSHLRWLDQWMQIPYDNIARGADIDTLLVESKSGQYQAQMTICYEDVFGEEIITSLPEANLLINVTNDGWFTGSLEPYQHLQISRMRSIETGRYLVRSANTGPSAIINQKGKIVASAPIYTTQLVTGSLQPMSGSTPYVSWGNWLIVSILSIIVILGYFVARKYKQVI